MSKKIIIVMFVIISSLFNSGCASFRRQIESAENTITELERSNAEGEARNKSLKRLYNSERSGNIELTRINGEIQGELDKYIESERRRIAAERELIGSISEIFGDGQGIVEQLIRGLDEIREITQSDKEVE